MTTGIHHLTAITRNVQANVDFYAGFLGLHLVKEIVQHHGGSVSVGEAAGGGASFRVNFHRGSVRR